MNNPSLIEHLQMKVKSRGIQLSPLLTDAELTDFEHSNGISLPSDYWDFLLHVGDGGDGPPDYGLCGFGKIPSDFDSALLDLSKPFPFTQPWIWEEGETSPQGEQDDAYCGVLILGTDGCAQYWALVVRGPDFGKIWMLADVGIHPTIPSMTFTEWYEAWLDGKTDW